MLYIIRGLPGSGKSTLAHKMGIVHFEPDMYAMHSGKYHFDANKLKDAIKWCNDCVYYNLTKGLDVAAVGTLTKNFNFAGYIKFCKEYHIPYKVIRCISDFGNIHEVPEQVLAKMKDELEPFEGEYLYDGDFDKLMKELWK